MIRVTTIGGGSGSFTLLTGLKEHPDIYPSAIVSMMDNGGSSGYLRSQFGILPPGDYRRALIALSQDVPTMRRLLEYRFPKGDHTLSEHNLGNLIIAALVDMTGNERDAYEQLPDLFNVRGDVHPVTYTRSQLHATLSDGRTIAGETNIDIPKHDGTIPISKVFLAPEAEANEAAIRSIHESDYIVIGPGDLYTSIIPNFLVGGVPEALRMTGAKKVYVPNLMTKFGETNGFEVHDFIDTIHRYSEGMTLDAIVVNTGVPSSALIKKYWEEDQSAPVTYDPEKVKERIKDVCETDVLYRNGIIRHDSRRLTDALVQYFNRGKHNG